MPSPVKFRTQWTSHPPFGHFAFAAFLAALLGYGGLLAYYTLANLDVVSLLRDGYVDFYYFEIAKNLAAGKFSTFDGGITRTNGYHPLWILLITPFYWVFDSQMALFGIRALEILLIAGAMALVAIAVRSARLPWILLFAALPVLLTQRGMLYGMEAAAGAFSLGATLLCAVLFVADAKRGRWALAGVAFALPWVRTEYVVIAVFVTGVLYLLPATGARSWQPRPYFSWAKLRADGLPLLAALASIGVYFLYNGVVFGGIVPVSGATKLAWGAEWWAGRDISVLDKWLDAGWRWIKAAGHDAIRSLELGIYVLAVLIVAVRRSWREEDRLLLTVLVVVLALGVETVAVKGLIAFFYTTTSPLYTSWYYAPGYLVAVLMVPVRCFVAIFFWRLLARGRSAPVQQAGVVAICIAGAYAMFDRATFTEPFRFVEASRDSQLLLYKMSTLANVRGAAVLDQLLPEDAVIGSWDADKYGYFAERPVIALDGLANSYAYLRRRNHHGFGMTHFVNVLKPTSPDLRGPARISDGTARLPRSATTLLPERTQRVRPEYVDTWRNPAGHRSLQIWANGDQPGRPKTWLSITSPSVGPNGSENGFRLRRFFGRMVQVFIPSCGGEDTANVHLASGVAHVPEVLRFSWREGYRHRSETRLWPRPVVTELGYCTTSFLLPQGAETAAKIAVEGITVEQLVGDSSPLLHSPYRVYAVANQLIYMKDACAGDDGWLFLHVYPARQRDLPLDRQRAGFDNYSGAAELSRRTTANHCLAAAELPLYEIDHVRTGQVDSANGQTTWSARIDGRALRPDAPRTSREPLL